MSDEPYHDHSQDEALLEEFNPDNEAGFALTMAATHIQRHLEWRNPVNRIAGLIALQVAFATSFSDEIQSQVKQCKWVLVLIVGLLGYIAYVLS